MDTEKERRIGQRAGIRQPSRLEVPESRLLVEDAPHQLSGLDPKIRQPAMDRLDIHPVNGPERENERRPARRTFPQPQPRAFTQPGQQRIIVCLPLLLERFPLRELPPPEAGVQLAQLDVKPQPLVGELVARPARYLAHRGVDVAFAGPTPWMTESTSAKSSAFPQTTHPPPYDDR